MKSLTKFSMLFMSIMILFILGVFAQAEGEPTTAPTNIFMWIGVGAAVIITLLSAVQIILKKIPTEKSIKLNGIVGKIIDILTFLVPDDTVEEKKSED